MSVTTSTVSLNADDVAASSVFLRTHFGFVERMAADGFASLGRDDAVTDPNGVVIQLVEWVTPAGA
ncbi:hypothetical protein [Streptomyces sp. NPDC005283]|uniref:hypothetical protein n=1 Tax=unclassified Streptomyces TaxID=2593676 RepID=UPI003452D6DA